MTIHRNRKLKDVHAVVSFESADEAARLALTLLSTDISKIVKQLDDSSFWMITSNIGPTFKSISDSGGGAALTDRSFNTQTGTTYTFVLTDSVKNSNKMVTFGNAASTEVTVPPNSSVAFPIGSQIDCLQLGAGTVSFTPGAGVTINSRFGYTVIEAQYGTVALIKTATDTWELMNDLGPSIISATGGDLTIDGDYHVRTFNSSGTFEILSGNAPVDYIIQGAGAGGGGNIGGGGAGGGFKSVTQEVMTVGSFTVTIGTKGTGGVNEASGTSGGNTSFNGITMGGGGHGSARTAGANTAVGNGLASDGNGGGGAGGSTGPYTAGTANGLGFAGGLGSGGSGGGGGGGTSAIGSAGSGGNNGGNGGEGTASSISGSSIVYGSGAGGGAVNSGTGGIGGTNAGNGHGTLGNGTSAVANTGSGGGGGSNGGTGGDGSDGRVVVRYRFQ